MEIEDSERERRLALFNARLKSELDLLRSAAEFGQSAIKLTMLVNGAAAVAMLAFIGRIERASLDSCAAWFLSLALLSFAVGAGGGVIGAIGAYLTQFSYLQSFEIEFLKDLGERISVSNDGEKLRKLTIIVICFSALLFFLGIILLVSLLPTYLSDNGKI